MNLYNLLTSELKDSDIIKDCIGGVWNRQTMIKYSSDGLLASRAEIITTKIGGDKNARILLIADSTRYRIFDGQFINEENFYGNFTNQNILLNVS